MSEKRYRVPFVLPLKEYFAKLAARRLTEDGREIPDPVPMAPPVGYMKQPSMVEHIRNMVRSEQLRMAAEAGGAETFEEADDFDVGEDELPGTPWEADFEPVSELKKRAAAEASGGSGGTPPPVSEPPAPGARSEEPPQAPAPQPSKAAAAAPSVRT